MQVSPDFIIGDEKEMDILKHESIIEVIEEFYDGDNSDNFADLVDLLSGSRDDGRLIETVYKVYNYARAKPLLPRLAGRYYKAI